MLQIYKTETEHTFCLGCQYDKSFLKYYFHLVNCGIQWKKKIFPNNHRCPWLFIILYFRPLKLKKL